MSFFSYAADGAVSLAMIVCVSIAPGVRRYEVVKPYKPVIERKIVETVVEPVQEPEIPEPEKTFVDVILTCSFYTSLEICNGPGYANINAMGGELAPGQIAAPYSIPFNTVFETEEFGTLTVADRGHPDYIKELGTNHYKVDIYIARNEGESDDDYYNRVLHMGIQTINARMYKEG